MLSPRTLLIDTCVWVAYLLGDEQRCPEVTRLFEAVVQGGGTLAYAPTSLKDVFYIVPRQLRRDAVEAGVDVDALSFAPAAWACVRTMTDIACAASVSLAECELAWMLRADHADFEDNLVIAAAETCGADYVVTYDEKLIQHFSPVCITPGQALQMLGRSRH